MQQIYLDHAATTPVHPLVYEAMEPFFKKIYGNPSSIHGFGRTVRLHIDEAREKIARSIHAEPGQIVFTSGGTEADNMAIIGVALANRQKGNHIITSQIEHHAVLHACEYLEKMGFEVTYLPVDLSGKVNLKDVAKAIKDQTILISIMYGNNEVGTLQPVSEIGHLAREKGIYVHSDAVQAFGTIPIDVSTLPVDLLSFSAHKMNGPKGIGALYISKKVLILPHILGGSQEKKRRAGTENVPGIIGFSKAVEIAMGTMEEKREKYIRFRKIMTDTFSKEEIVYHVNGHSEEYLPHILNVSFPGTKTETLLMALDMEGIAAASGSACSSGSLEVSHVLRSMCLKEELTQSAVRFSFGYGLTEEDIQLAAKKTAQIVKRLIMKKGKTPK
ncbi:cysteine desulfurase [Microaerobacter geothermalis]|uniref:cysteine desulfurase family protein n=1 Tax=Microaerobacter geothermalis TaxID=674972 RepID=UPI001F1CFF23|nr:cysteine desulfurase family protein [Microaerobacter geothermalis]MCF6093986.1 cysteine desulfurase [Microaerobacter geothermalis]